MADHARTAPHAVMPHASAPQDFYQLLRRFECRYRTAPRIGYALRAAHEVVRLGQEASLAFAPGAVASVTQSSATTLWQLRVHCFGMLGPNGPLPLHLTEYVRQRREHYGDTALSRFLDLFHHRLLSLFYRVWADAQPAVQHDRHDGDRFADYVASLIGLGSPALRERDALPDTAKLFYAGRLAAQVRNAEGLCRLISDYFDLPAAVEEFVGEWSTIPDRYRWRLVASTALAADANQRLGHGTHLGGRVWMRQSRFRIVLGPLTRPQFESVAPGGAAIPILDALVRAYVGDELSWEVQLKLESAVVPGLRLGHSLLGQSSWLSPARAGLNDDLLFEPRLKQTDVGQHARHAS